MKQANFSRIGAIALVPALGCASSLSDASGKTVTVYSAFEEGVLRAGAGMIGS